MIKCEVIENFTLEKFNQLKNVNKVISRKDNEFGVKDTFECDKEMADYLLGNNVLNKVVVKVIEVIKETPKKDVITIIENEEAKNIVNDYYKELCEEKKVEKPKKKKTSKK